MGTVRYTVIDGEIISEVRNGVRRDYVPDPLGSTVALLDGSNNKTDTWEYWPFGEVRTRTGTTATPFQFVGTLGYYRDSSSRTYVRARHYRPRLGRWQTVDLLWPDELEFNYSANNPVSTFDYLGLEPQPIPGQVPRLRIVPGGRTGGAGAVGKGGIIGLGIWAACDLAHWLATGEEGTFTGIGGAIGRACFPNPEPQCPGTRDFKNCPDSLLAVLNAAVKAACKGGAALGCGGLSYPKDEFVIHDRINKLKICARARRDLNARCYNGGNKRHTDHLIETENAIRNCTKLLKRKK